jgi:hypothetical protein
MKLQVPFVQLPLQFDAARLAQEIAQFDESDWRPHPLGYPGNTALPLIAVDGDANNDGFVGPMRATSYLARCPYIVEALASLGAVWGRTRLMRLSGQAEVEPHVDINYYWHERVRVHIPIRTQPGVRFICGEGEVNMAPGECWIFDTWREHRVINAHDDMRVHLVADTVGSEAFWQIANAGRAHGHKTPAGWAQSMLHPQPGRENRTDALQYESVNSPIVMTPWEARAHVSFLFAEAAPQPQLDAAHAAAMRFLGRWQALWAQYGEAQAGWPEYRRTLDTFSDELREYALGILLRNGVNLNRVLNSMVIRMALADRPLALAEQAVESVEASAELRYIRSRAGVDPAFERPVFVLSAPRSGSTLLFETLAQAANAYTIGDESHVLIESIPELHPAARGYASNRLDADAATPNVTIALRAAFRAALRDRAQRPAPAGPLRMLEKTPKNALRVPFLAQIFPEAHFVYLYRDVRQVLASMIEAWNSGRFSTYPKLPGWTGLPWSLLLTPGWRELDGRPLHDVVAAQWQATTRTLLDDLAMLPANRVHVARYDTLIADPSAQIARLCNALGFVWDKPLVAHLPLSRYTLSDPDPDKWRRHAADIDAVLPALADTIARAEQFATR